MALKVFSANNPAFFRASRLAGDSRVLLCGDSLTGLYSVDGGAVDKLTALGYVVQTLTNAGTGLLDAPCHGILNAVTAKINSFDPDVVVLEWRGNYKAFGNPGCTPSVVGDTPAFYTAWQTEAEAVTNACISRFAQTYWILGPSMATLLPDGTYDPNNPADRVTRTIANNIKAAVDASFPRVGYINTYKLFPDPWSGLYDCCGNEVRTWDGLHYSSPLGCQIMADEVIDRIIPHH